MDQIHGERIRAHTKFLASDLLEGRGVGVRGGDLATEYIAAQMQLMGLKPGGDNGTYFQKVPLVGAEPMDTAKLSAVIKGGKKVDFGWQEEFTGVTHEQKPQSSFSAEAVFVGHGITAPEFNWDDYKGVDVAGKVVVLFTNEPPSEKASFFGGKALTYYGRWTYKYEQALRKGAVACLILHTTPTAGYGWQVVQGFGREDAQVALDGGQKALAFAGWLSKKASEEIAGSVGKSVDELLKMADTPGFQAMPLPVTFTGTIPMKVRKMDTRNVVAWIEGADPKGKSEAIVYSAHWDHLGIGSEVNGDKIYNGAVDNATGCAMLLEMARAWASLPVKPRRSVVFTFVTAEESGLRGADFYAKKPLFPVGKTIVDLNFDAFYPFGRTKDIGLNGAERTTLWPTVQEIARRYQLSIEPDPRPEQGHFYRSDHFSFAKAGIPAFSINGGNQFLGKPEGYGDGVFIEYNSKNYHQPSDEYSDKWDFSGMEQMAKFGYTLGLTIANQSVMSTWRANDEFLPARQRSLVQQ
ncbi:aminopeptidase [Bryobacterales bacterium F-183]|nr:aminopeptidase [Bryobacterales bacterium F-183]